MWKRIVLMVVFSLLLVGAIVVVQNWDNLMALRMATNHTASELEELQSENEQQLLEKLPVEVHPLTSDQTAQLQKGEITKEQAIAIITGREDGSAVPSPEASPSLSAGAAAPTGSPSASPTAEVSAAPTPSASAAQPSATPQPEASAEPTDAAQDTGASDDAIATAVANLYVLEAEYNGQLAGIYQSAVSQYQALDPSQQTSAAKASIAAGCTSQASQLEAAADADIAAQVSSLRSLLSASGGDTSIADEAQAYYASEKSIVKAQYMQQLG